MSLPIHVALTCDKLQIDAQQLTEVASALSKQVQNDFTRYWPIEATVDAFVNLDDVPLDYWPIIVLPVVKGAAGFHEDDHGQPFALVEFGPEWSLTASHELLEMLADPFGRRLKSGNMLQQAVDLGRPKRRVRYLVEVCDPCESGEFAYQIDGVLVSDFYTRRYFSSARRNNENYSFTGAIDAPRKVLSDGYISWHDPVDDNWWQLRMFRDDISSDVPHLVNLSTQTDFNKFRKSEGSLRAAVDRVTRNPTYQAGLQGTKLTSSQTYAVAADKAQESVAASRRKLIQSLIGSAGGGTGGGSSSGGGTKYGGGKSGAGRAGGGGGTVGGASGGGKGRRK